MSGACHQGPGACGSRASFQKKGRSAWVSTRYSEDHGWSSCWRFAPPSSNGARDSRRYFYGWEPLQDFCDASDNADLREGWEFFLNWPVTLGDEPPEGRCLGGLKLYLIHPEAAYSGDSCLSPADWARISHALGWMPACELSVWINCKRPRDHKVLGWFSAELATRFDGMIDLNGALPLPNPPDQWGAFGLAGKVVQTVYDLDAGRTAALHIVDAEFLHSWMPQPQFHMIK